MSFPRYPKYKPSGVEWLGEVPQHWNVTRLGFLCEKIGSGKTPSGGSETYADEGVVFIRSQNVYDEGLFLDDVVCITVETDEEMAGSRVREGDVLLNITGASLGRTCLVPSGFAGGNVNQHVCIIRLIDHALRKFAAMSMKSVGMKAQIDATQNGAARDGLNYAQISKLALTLPPTTEQTKIASFLDRETSKIDGLVGEQRRLMELLKEKRQAVISHAVTQGLNPHAPLKPSGIEWLGDVPEHWAIPAVFTRYHAVLGKMVDEKQLTGAHPICYLRNADVNWDRINITDLPVFDIEPDDVERFSLRPGDVLICEGGAGIGQTAIWQGELDRCAFQKALHRLRPWSDDEDPRFFYYCMRNAVETGVVLAGGTATIPHLTGEQLRKYRFPRPPIKEQRQIVEHLDCEIGKLEQLTAEAERGIELLQERRTALISAAVTGQIDVRGLAETEAA